MSKLVVDREFVNSLDPMEAMTLSFHIRRYLGMSRKARRREGVTFSRADLETELALYDRVLEIADYEGYAACD